MLLPYYDTYACTGPQGGSACDLVLLHGWGMHSAIWDPIMPSLLEHFQVTVIDLPGMGRSPLPKQTLTLSTQVEMLARIAPAHAVWMGWSLGGALALAFAERYPERVMAVVTVASNPCFVERTDWPSAMKAEVFQQFVDFYQEDPEATLIRFLSLQCQGSPRVKDDIRFMQELVYHHGLPAPRALREGLLVLRDSDVRSAWAGLACPALAILGARDALVPAAIAPLLQPLNPAAQVAVVAESSHVPFVCQREAVEVLLREFIERHALASA